MKEIKFRAINREGEFIYGLPYTDGVNETLYFKEYSNRLCWRRESDGAHCNQPYKNGTLSQYTGIKDKNGIEIYEGDIIKTISLSNDHHQRGAVNMAVIETFYGNTCLSINRTPLYPFLVTHEIEVIGNIYANPELLTT